MKPIAAQAQTPIPPADMQTSEAQSGLAQWSQPINLSRSGAASEPRIFAGQDGRLQAFWIDKFDGLTTAIFDGARWSEPISMPVTVLSPSSRRGQVEEMPFLMVDSVGRIHALWYGKEDPIHAQRPLYYNFAILGETTFSTPLLVTASAPVFSLTVSKSGKLYLAFVRTLQSEVYPAGVYVTSQARAGAGWANPVAIATSIYYRSIPLEMGRLDLVNIGKAGEPTNDLLYLAWDDPHLQQTYLSYSTNSGISWTGPVSFEGYEARTAFPRLVMLPQDQGLMRIWQSTDVAACALQQQLVSPSYDGFYVQKLNDLPADMSQWILTDLNECPLEEDFLSMANNQGLLWLWNQGSARLDMALWQPSRGDWEQLESVSFSFLDPEIRRTVLLDDMHATLLGNRLVVIGANVEPAEVWVTIGPPISNDITEASTEKPLWSSVQNLFSESQVVYDPASYGSPAIGMNRNGQVFTIWAQPSLNGADALFYARLESAQTPEISLQTASSPVEIIPGRAGFLNRQPALLIDDNANIGEDSMLHLVWSSGLNGEVRYSRANSQQAGSSGGWMPAITISGHGVAASAASWPQIGMDDLGRLFVIYVLPLNEGRGVYLVRSDDGGNNWTKPLQVFDASADNWQMVDHPTLAVTADGVLHLAWVQQSSLKESGPIEIFYSSSVDQAQSMSEFLPIAEAGFDWPRLVLAGGQLHFLYAKVADGSIWHRWQADASQLGMVENWSIPIQVPGWKDVNLPYGVAISGRPQSVEGVKAGLYLAGMQASKGTLLLSNWGGERWVEVETYQPPTQVELSSPVEKEAGTSLEFDYALSATSRPEGGILAMAWWRPQLTLTQLAGAASSGEMSQDMLYAPALAVISREIAPVVVPPLPPRPTLAPALTPTADQASALQPTATPPLTGAEPPGESVISPLVLGSGLAAIIIVAIFVGLLTRSRKRK